tara:strand:+ start:418 stop:717 length:300 start_codon:yes stop_codon:yes gene_type:complete
MKQMVWSIFDSSEIEFNIPLRSAFYYTDYGTSDVVKLNDGFYPVSFDGAETLLEVRDGEWRLDTEDKLATLTSNYHGVYIEGFICNPQTGNTIQAIIGS